MNQHLLFLPFSNGSIYCINPILLSPKVAWCLGTMTCLLVQISSTREEPHLRSFIWIQSTCRWWNPGLHLGDIRGWDLRERRMYLHTGKVQILVTTRCSVLDALKTWLPVISLVPVWEICHFAHLEVGSIFPPLKFGPDHVWLWEVEICSNDVLRILHSSFKRAGSLKPYSQEEIIKSLWTSNIYSIIPLFLKVVQNI